MSQNFESIVDTSKIWVVLENSSADPPYFNGGKTCAYKLKDSILNTEKYWLKLWESSDSFMNQWRHVGYLNEREKIVLHMDLSFKIDTLYDFNKKGGEAIRTNGCDIQITLVDTTNFIGKDRMTVHVNGHTYFRIKFYEGIGSNEGLLSPFYSCMTGSLRYLICYYKNGELKYHDENFNSCYYYITTVPKITDQQIKVYPNPVIAYINIDNIDISKGLVLEIFTTEGIRILSAPLKNINNRINLKKFKGLLIVRVMSNEGKSIYTESIIK